MPFGEAWDAASVQLVLGGQQEIVEKPRRGQYRPFMPQPQREVVCPWLK